MSVGVYSVSAWLSGPFWGAWVEQTAFPMMFIDEIPLSQMAPHLDGANSPWSQVISGRSSFGVVACEVVAINANAVYIIVPCQVFVFICFVSPRLKNTTVENNRWLEVRNYKRV